MSKLILHNDDVNSTTKIASALIKCLDYELPAANQIIILAEGREKGVVIKEGDFIELYMAQSCFEELNIITELIA
jgi:ATP-dependent Clp protease adapter protein ClpS